MSLDQPPFIERPDQTKLAEEQLFCFLNNERPCDASCAAYVGFGEEKGPKDGKPSAVPERVRRCVVLAGTERVGRYLGVLAQVGAKALEQLKIDAIDRARGGP